MKTILFSLLGISLLISCRKAENRTCWKGWGKETTLEIPMKDFDKLFLSAHLEYEIIQDSTNKLVIIGGDNMVNHVGWSIDKGMLRIENNNKCSFLRDERKTIKVEIHCTSVYNIFFEGSEPLNSRGKLKADYFTLYIRDGAGPVALDLDCISVNADISHGWGDYTLRGNVQYAFIGARSNGFCDTRGLTVSDSIYVSNESSGKIKVNTGNLPLYGYLKSNGNIEYIGNPSSVHIVNTGDGKVVDLD